MLSIRSTASVLPAMSVLRVNRVLEHDPKKLQTFLDRIMQESNVMETLTDST
jgi:hypothetical protein